MTSIAGAKLITAATLFGGAAVVFSLVPFLIVVLKGMIDARNPTTAGSDVLKFATIAFGVHVVASVGFRALILILDYLNTQNQHYIAGTIFPIFWAAANKSSVLSLSGAGSSTEADAAYSTLYGLYVIVTNMYMLIPLLVFSFAAAYGVGLAKKDVYRQDHLTVISYSAMSIVVASTLFVAWAKIANEALFTTNTNLLAFIQTSWSNLL